MRCFVVLTRGWGRLVLESNTNAQRLSLLYVCVLLCFINGGPGPEPLEKEIKKMLGSKREDRLSDLFFDLV